MKIFIIAATFSFTAAFFAVLPGVAKTLACGAASYHGDTVSNSDIYCK